MIWLLAYAAGGVVVGFLAGLLGVGGGMTMVPVLAALFAAQGFAPDHIVHLALATAMSSIMFTSTSSVREHHRHGAVDWQIVRRMAPGMLLGTFAATSLSVLVSQHYLALIFAVVITGSAIQILLGKKPKAERPLPGPVPLFFISAAIGIVAGLVSAGGAFMSMPFMVFCGVPMLTAIGTGAAMSIPIAVIGAAGYAIAGWNAPNLPPHSVGFIYLPALLAIVCASMVTAKFGARLAHRMPVQILKRCFAVLLFILAGKMLVSYW